MQRIANKQTNKQTSKQAQACAGVSSPGVDDFVSLHNTQKSAHELVVEQVHKLCRQVGSGLLTVWYLANPPTHPQPNMRTRSPLFSAFSLSVSGSSSSFNSSATCSHSPPSLPPSVNSLTCGPFDGHQTLTNAWT
jgi:hypothetical protein